MGVRCGILIAGGAGWMVNDFVNLGKTGIKISSMGLGTMQWGDFPLSVQAGEPVDENIRKIFLATLDAGINFFDTAQVYGSGKSENHLGRCLRTGSKSIIVATKFMPYPWRMARGYLRISLLKSLNRLGLNHIDLYQMHWPLPFITIKSWMEAMADAVAEGLIHAVGVSNYSVDQTRVAYEILEKHHIPLASNQVKYNLLDRYPERSGLVNLCKDLGITIIAYSPLEKGILTGKYTPNHLPGGSLSWRYTKSYLDKLDPFFGAIREIGQAHGGKTSASVSLNWLISKGAVPIPGARNLLQAQENAGGLGWQLSGEEINRLDRMSEEITR